MTQEQLAKLIKSWNYILENSNDTGVYFYQRLFIVRPEFKLLFNVDMGHMAEKFMATIGVILAKAHKGNSLIADVQHLALRHVSYGVVADHYPAVGEALLAALEYGLKDHWNDEIKSLWIKLYESLAEAMITISSQTRNNQVA